MRLLSHSRARIPLFGLASLVFFSDGLSKEPGDGPRRPARAAWPSSPANRFTIHRGESSVLSCMNAKGVTISDIGAVGPSGAFPVRPVATTTYVLTAQFASGTVTRAVTISVP